MRTGSWHPLHHLPSTLFLHPQLQVCARSCEVLLYEVLLCDSTWGNRDEAQPSLLLLEAVVVVGVGWA